MSIRRRFARKRKRSGRSLPVWLTLGKALALFGRKFWLYLLLYIIFLSPLYALDLGFDKFRSDSMDSPTADFERMGKIVAWYRIAHGLLFIFLDSLATGAVLYCLFRCLKGANPRIDLALKVTISRFLPLVGVIFCITIVNGFSVVGINLLDDRYDIVIDIGIFELLGINTYYVLLSCLIYTPVAASVPAVMAEKAGVIQAFKRSFQLTKGNRWRICAILLIVQFTYYIAISYFFTKMIDSESLMEFSSCWEILSRGSLLILSAFEALVIGLIYFNLRVSGGKIKEEELISVFD